MKNILINKHLNIAKLSNDQLQFLSNLIHIPIFELVYSQSKNHQYITQNCFGHFYCYNLYSDINDEISIEDLQKLIHNEYENL